LAIFNNTMETNPQKKPFRIEEYLEHVSARSRTFIALLDERNVYFYFEGVTDVDSFELMRPALDKVAESGKCSIFSDGEFNKASTPANRELWTQWFQAHPGKVLATNVLFPSAILQMALQVVTTITGEQMTPHADANAFYMKLRTQVPSILRQSRAWPADISERISQAAFGSKTQARR
jgi:hypothetical protein